MAFTTDEEAKLRQIISAFDNGKRLTDLPEVQGTNPFNMITEVLDEDGESKKAALASLLPYTEEQCAYGIEFDTTISSPTCTRIGNMALHKSLPIHNRMRGCLLDDNGKVVEYLNPKTWLEHDRSGARGQVMVEIPMHYRKFETDGTKRRVKLSEFPIPGYHLVPTMYVSAYEASLQRSTLKLSSVVNETEDYRGGNNNANYDGKYNSLLGKPATQITRGNFRKYARNRNAAATTEWNCYTYDVHKTITWLFVVEYATLNSQAAFNAELTAEGYHQGGLGEGISNWNWSPWATFNGQNPFVPCGYTDSLGNGTGEISITVSNDDESITFTGLVNRYRGVELPFGHIWKWADGCNFEANPTEENGGNGLTKAYVCHNPALFQDTNYDGYEFIGNMPTSGSWIKEIVFGERGDILPMLLNGGSTIFFCDNFYYRTNNPSTDLRVLAFGGNAFDGSLDGLFYSSSGDVPSIAHAYVGSRLCFISATAK